VRVWNANEDLHEMLSELADLTELRISMGD
jgi:hypothetical protein